VINPWFRYGTQPVKGVTISILDTTFYVAIFSDHMAVCSIQYQRHFSQGEECLIIETSVDDIYVIAFYRLWFIIGTSLIRTSRIDSFIPGICLLVIRDSSLESLLVRYGIWYLFVHVLPLPISISCRIWDKR